MKRALIIQHTAVDSPGVVHEILLDAGIQVEIVRLDRGAAIPRSVSADALFSFGGPVSLHHADLPEWVAEERALMKHYLRDGKRVMGICLGAQLLANSLGANTYSNAEREVGWFPVHRVEGAPNWLPEELTVLHWHQNTFELPDQAVHLFQSEACRHQGFAVGDQAQAVGFQFHPEVTKQTIEYFLAVSGLCRKPFPFVQTRQAILEGMERHLVVQHAWLRDFLNDWLH